MLHAATVTAGHVQRSEVAIWQLHAAALTASRWGFPIGVKKRIRKQRYGFGYSVAFQASAELPQPRVPGDVFSDNLHEWSQDVPRRHPPESILVASFRASGLWLRHGT